jgi:putative restriction endonuclease
MAQRFDQATDERLRLAAFAKLRALLLRTAGVVRFDDVAGFEFEGERIPLLDRQLGIRKPRQTDAALSIRTVYSNRPDRRPYDDEPGPDGLLRYKWRGTDPTHFEVVGLRRCMERQLPLIWFHGVAQGTYVPIFPVWLVHEEPDLHQFVVALDDQQAAAWAARSVIDTVEQRRFAERTAMQRLHQPLFRAQVLGAYGERCALCNLRHVELLDAAHIRPDSDGGDPVVTNGIAMCKIHHAAFDAQIVGIRPDLEIVVRNDVLDEVDGPTLRYAIQGLHGATVQVPSRRSAQPDVGLLEERFASFQGVA